MSSSTRRNSNVQPVTYPLEPFVEFPKSVAVHSVAVQKANQSIGVHLKKSKGSENPVEITAMTPSSPLVDTLVQAGQLLLAINGDSCLPSASAAAKLIRDAYHPSFLVCDKPKSGSCIQVAAAPFSSRNPGVLFSSARGGALVRLSKLFRRGPFADNPNIQKGDIVIAVNGVPVSNAEDAKKELLTPLGKQSVTVLHILSMNMLRNNIAANVKERLGVDLSIEYDADSDDLFIGKKYKELRRPERLFSIAHDPETLHLVDPKQHTRMVPDVLKMQVDFPTWYQIPSYFMKQFNDALEVALDIFEDDVCEAAWIYQTATSATNVREVPIIRVSAERTILPVPEGIPMVEAACVCV